MRVSKETVYREIPEFGGNIDIDGLLRSEKDRRDRVVAVLDDDPTGIQTVHDVYVYTDWSRETLEDAFKEGMCFFIHTNTRAKAEEDTAEINRTIMKNCVLASRKTGKDFTVMSRSDSTLRGHYPLETSVLREVYEAETRNKVHGEVLTPCFFEGGRFTYNDIHFVGEGEDFIPAGETEYAKDSVFGYGSSNLREYIEEKTNGRWKTGDVVSIPLELMRSGDTDEILRILMSAEGFCKIVVNAMSYDDLRVFLIACFAAERGGKRFIYRTAASFVKAYCMIEDRALLDAEDIRRPGGNGGAVVTVVGSHVKKSSEQLAELLKCERVCGVELDVERVLEDETARQAEMDKAVQAMERAFDSSLNPVLYTSRKLIRTDGSGGKDNLEIAQTVSMTLVEIVKRIRERAWCIIAKGGTTSSDILVKALRIKKACVAGQVIPGVPLLFLPGGGGLKEKTYIIYPGNVGDRDSLADVYKAVLA